MKKYILATLCYCLMTAGASLPSSACPDLADKQVLAGFKEALKSAVTYHGKVTHIIFEGEDWDISKSKFDKLAGSIDSIKIESKGSKTFTDPNGAEEFEICYYTTDSKTLPEFTLGARTR